LQQFQMLLFAFFHGSFGLTSQQTVILNCLKNQIGKPYVWGAAGPDSFDCSGLSSYCHKAANITIPRTSRDQSTYGRLINCSIAEVGDLVFFFTPVSHVGTFSSGTSIIHGVNEQTPITESTNIFKSTYWSGELRWCRRNWDEQSVTRHCTATRAVTATSRATVSDEQKAIVSCVEASVGIRYQPGGSSQSGFDASGLTQYCHSEAGIALPHGSLAQASLVSGSVVPCGDALPGDVVFYFDPISFVGTFTSATDVVQVADTAAGVRVYTNIFENSVYGPEIKFCKRFWKSGGSLTHEPTPTTVPTATVLEGLTPQQSAIVGCLRAQIGKPYVWGAVGPEAFDCSGLTSFCHAAANISIPRLSSAQAVAGTAVPCDSASAGDLIFFYNPVSHVAAFSSHTDVIHAVNEEKPISEYTNIFGNAYWSPQIQWCRRYWTDESKGQSASTTVSDYGRLYSATVSSDKRSSSVPVGSETPKPKPKPTPTPDQGRTPQQRAILECLEAQLGKPYKPAGEGPDAFDASGLTKYCFAQAGIALPHGSSAQMEVSVGHELPCAEVEPADVVFYFNPVSFVGTFLNGTAVIQVADTPQGVRVYGNIWTNNAYGSEIYKCVRFWTDGGIRTVRPPPSPTPARSLRPGMYPQQSTIVDCLEAQVGIEYFGGGDDPKIGFDASGLTSYCFAKAGILLPHGSAAQFETIGGTDIDCDSAHPADVMFFNNPVDFVGTLVSTTATIMVAGDSTNAIVRRYDNIRGNSYYGERIHSCRRFWRLPSESPTESPRESIGQRTIVTDTEIVVATVTHRDGPVATSTDTDDPIATNADRNANNNITDVNTSKVSLIVLSVIGAVVGVSIIAVVVFQVLNKRGLGRHKEADSMTAELSGSLI
jgi:cell wall-associated NlpC family hydrolase